MDVAGGDQRNAHPASDFDGPLKRHLLDFQPVVLNLDKVSIPKRRAEPAGNLDGLLVVRSVALDQGPVQLAGDAATQAKDPFAVCLKDLLVYPRAEVKPLQIGRRGELQQVLETGLILSQQRDMVTRLLHTAGFAMEAARRCNVPFVSEDRLDPLGLCLLIELQGAVQVAVVGERQGIHPQVLGPFDQPLYRARPIQ